MADLDIDTQRGSEDLNLQEQGLTSTRITSSSSSRESSFSLPPPPFRGTELRDGVMRPASVLPEHVCFPTFQRLSPLIPDLR